MRYKWGMNHLWLEFIDHHRNQPLEDQNKHHPSYRGIPKTIHPNFGSFLDSLFMGLPHTYSHPNIQESGHLWIFILWIGLESKFHVFCPGKRNGHCCDILNSSGNPESLEPWNLVGYKIGSYPWYTADYHNPYEHNGAPEGWEKLCSHFFYATRFNILEPSEQFHWKFARPVVSPS